MTPSHGPNKAKPSSGPSQMPSSKPSTSHPSRTPSHEPSKAEPSSGPSQMPSSKPSTSVPSMTRSQHPSDAPTPRSATSSSILPNWDFEEPTIDPWIKNGGSTIEQSAEHAHSGNFGGLVTGRETDWEGVAQQVAGLIEPGVIYEVSVWVKLVNVTDDTTATFKLTMKETYDDGSTSYRGIITSSGSLTDEWQHFVGSYTLEDGDSIAELRLYAQGPENGYDFAIDDLMMRDSKPSAVDYLVGADDNTEQVTIPQPPPADVSSPRTNCPHLGAIGHTIDWKTQFTSLVEGEDVSLPENTSILVTQSITTKLGLVTIPATSELIFGEDATGITMDVEGMEVEGSLIAGSETCRYETPLTITLHGTRPDGITNIANAEPTSYKGISVTGRLELHGKRYYRTWTR
jgi:hypothetical protein